MKLKIRLLPLVVALCLLAVTSVRTDGQDAPDWKAGDNTWAGSKAGDWVEYTLTDGPRVRFEITAIAENKDITFQHIIYNPKGEVVSDNPRTRAPGEAPVQGRVPANIEVAWSDATYAIGDATLACQVATWSQVEATSAIWFCKDVPCGGIVKTITDGKESVWLSGFRKDGKEQKLAGPAPQPEPQPEPEPPRPEPEQPAPQPDVVREFGDAITMKLPEKVRQQMSDQGIAITRMRVYFEEQAGDNGAVIEYEGMRTEVPVIYAAFIGDECDKELSYRDWLARDGRYVDLRFDVKSRPRMLKGMKVQIVHSHLQGETESELSTFEVTVPEDGEAWDSLRLRGAKPGINRYTLVVSYTDGQGQTTTHRGFSHWVVVQAPPMFEFLNEVSARATRTGAGGNTALSADVTMTGSFILHHGLKPEDCSLRITRNGKREMDLSALPAELRRVIAKEEIPPGWQEVARVKFSDGILQGAKVVEVEDSFVRVTFGHAFAASAAVLPVKDRWEYRFELLHKDSALPLATWNVNVDLSIDRPEDIAGARLNVRATGREKPLEAPFVKQ